MSEELLNDLDDLPPAGTSELYYDAFDRYTSVSHPDVQWYSSNVAQVVIPGKPRDSAWNDVTVEWDEWDVPDGRLRGFIVPEWPDVDYRAPDMLMMWVPRRNPPDEHDVYKQLFWDKVRFLRHDLERVRATA